MSFETRLPLVLAALVALPLSLADARDRDLSSPFALDSADTLPKNVRNPRFISIFSSVTGRFSDGGLGEGLGAPLNKVVTARDVAKEQEDPAQSTIFKGFLAANGIDENSAVGSTTGEVNSFASVQVAALAWGITDRFTLAGVLPIINVDVSASTGFVPSSDPTYSQVVSALSATSGPRQARDATYKFNDAINRKLTRLGYQPIPSRQTFSGVGDAQLVGKYRLYNDGVNGVALKGTILFPTGQAANPDRALDVPLGNGAFGAGMSAIYDRRLPLDLRWDSYASYTALLPHSITKRIPTSVADPLSADKEQVYQYTRSQFALGTGVDHLFPSAGVILGAGYSYQFFTRADYGKGTRFTEDRYYLLGDQQPLESLHSVMVSAAFSTVQWYKSKKFFMPLQAGVSYSHPMNGRNVPAGDLFSGELVVFF